MGKDEWFCRTTWTPSDREEFHARLKRSRGASHKAQYLRIQALHLQQTGKPDLVAAAVELLDELIAQYPEELQLAAAHLQRAECLDALDRPVEAIASFRASVEAQRAFPNLQTRVAYVFGMFCVRRALDSLLDEAAGYLDELDYQSPFPIDVFQANAVLAIVHEKRGEHDVARAFATGAIQAAQMRSSGLPDHAHLGLVGEVDRQLMKRLERLAG